MTETDHNTRVLIPLLPHALAGAAHHIRADGLTVTTDLDWQFFSVTMLIIDDKASA